MQSSSFNDRVSGEESPIFTNCLSDANTEILAGYGIIRLLGETTSTREYLGIADSPSSTRLPQLVTLKVFRNARFRQSADTEASALARVEGPHVVALIDFATTRSGNVCLVLEHLQHGNLAHLLANRDGLSPGEVVTLLAPIAESVDAMHAAGVSHGSLQASSIRFNHSGAPVISCFDHATIFDAGMSLAALSAHAYVHADRLSLATLVSSVISHTRAEEFDVMSQWLLRCVREGFPDNFGNELAVFLYDVAEPLPINLTETRITVRAAQLNRVIAVDTGSPQRIPAEEGAMGAAWTSRTSALVDFLVTHLPSPLSRWFERAVSRIPIDSWMRAIDGHRFTEALASVRKPVWLAAIVVAAALLAALAFSSGSNVSSATRTQDKESFTDIEAAETGSALSAVDGDDPILAATALIDERQRCIRNLSILCLDGVAQQGSTAMESDVALIRSLQSGGEVLTGPFLEKVQCELVERLGDTALLVALPTTQRPAAEVLGRESPRQLTNGSPGTANSATTEEGKDLQPTSGEVVATTPTASLLLMKGEAGWRIRSYVDSHATS
ncbi:MAG: protein kinase domain-containing protein [Microbacteriaceae bacterium]